MKKKMILAAVICFGVIGTASASFLLSAQDKADIAVMYLTKKLDLDENQASKLEVIKDEFQKVHKEHVQERAEKTQMIIEMIQSDQIDQAKVIELVNAKLLIIQEKAPQFVDKVADFHSTLSAEQKQIIIERIEQHKHF